MCYAQAADFSGCSVHILSLSENNACGISGIILGYPKSCKDILLNTKQINYILGYDIDKINTKRMWERYTSNTWSPILFDPAKSIPLNEEYFVNFDPNRKGLAIGLKHIKKFGLISDQSFNENWIGYQGVFNPIKQWGYVPTHLRKYGGRIIVLRTLNYDRIYEAYVTERGWSFLRCISFDTDTKVVNGEDPDELLEQLYEGWCRYIVPIIHQLTRMGVIN